MVYLSLKVEMYSKTERKGKPTEQPRVSHPAPILRAAILAHCNPWFGSRNDLFFRPCVIFVFLGVSPERPYPTASLDHGYQELVWVVGVVEVVGLDAAVKL